MTRPTPHRLLSLRTAAVLAVLVCLGWSGLSASHISIDRPHGPVATVADADSFLADSLELELGASQPVPRVAAPLVAPRSLDADWSSTGSRGLTPLTVAPKGSPPLAA